MTKDPASELQRYERPKSLIHCPWFNDRYADINTVPPFTDDEKYRQLRTALASVRSIIELPDEIVTQLRRYDAAAGRKPLGRIIPTTPLVARYRAVKAMSQAQKRTFADELVAIPGLLANEFHESVKRFADYPQLSPVESMLGGRDDSAAFDRKRSKTRLAASKLSKAGTIDVKGAPELSFKYIGRELFPARATGGAKFDDVAGTPAKSAMSADLVLVNADPDDRTPIIAELKISEANTADLMPAGPWSYDKDPFYALIQALAVAAQVATPEQYERLRSVEGFRGRFRDPDPQPQVDVYILIAGEPPERYEGWHELDKRASELAAKLVLEPGVSPPIRRLRFLDLDLLSDPPHASERRQWDA